MDILTAGQHLRSCANSSIGRKSPSTSSSDIDFLTSTVSEKNWILSHAETLSGALLLTLTTSALLGHVNEQTWATVTNFTQEKTVSNQQHLSWIQLIIFAMGTILFLAAFKLLASHSHHRSENLQHSIKGGHRGNEDDNETDCGFIREGYRGFLVRFGVKVASSATLPTKGLRHRYPGDGNCLFYCLAGSSDPTTAQALRNQTADWIRTHWDEDLVPTTDSKISECIGEEGFTAQTYHSHMLNSKSWGGVAEIIAFSKLTGTQVEVFTTPDNDKSFHLQFTVGSNPSSITRLIFSGSHFDALNLQADDSNESTTRSGQRRTQNQKQGHSNSNSEPKNVTKKGKRIRSTKSNTTKSNSAKDNTAGSNANTNGTISTCTKPQRPANYWTNPTTKTNNTNDNPDTTRATADVNHDDENKEKRNDDNDDDGNSLVGRMVLRFFDTEKRWFLGKIVRAEPPNPEDPDDEGWVFTVKYDDGDQGDYTLAQLEPDLLPKGMEDAKQLHDSGNWKLLKTLYDAVRGHLQAGTLSPSNDNCLRDVFNMRSSTRITVESLRKRANDHKRRFHHDKVNRQPTRVRYLAKLVYDAMVYLQQSHQHLTNPATSVNNPPTASDYPVYFSEEFAKAATSWRPSEGVDPDDLTPPSQPRQREGDRENTHEHGGDESDIDDFDPWETDFSMNSQTQTPLDQVLLFGIQRFESSPFFHVTTVPKKHQELWAQAFNMITRELIEALKARGRGRRRRITAAASWYLGMPQLFLREMGYGPKRSAGAIHRRLTQFHNGDYTGLLDEWNKDFEKWMKKIKPMKEDTESRRTQHCIDLFHKGYVSRGLQILEGHGRARSEDDEIKKQMIDKHPQHDLSELQRHLPPQAATTLSLPSLRQVVRDSKLLVGVGPRGFKAGHIKCLESGAFGNDDAKGAFDSFTDLGAMFLDEQMPRWLRQALNAGLLTPLIKKPAIKGHTPDARPTNARDIDVACWCKALQRNVNEAARKQLTPQQLAVAVSGGTQIKIIGAKMELEKAKKENKPYVHIAMDMKNAHNSFLRLPCQLAMEKAAGQHEDLIQLARAHHSDCSQEGWVFIRDSKSENGLSFLCPSTAGGPQGSAITNVAFPMVIDEALKTVEEQFPGVVVRAIQDDIDVMGNPDLIFSANGTQGALDFLLEQLRKVGLEPNLKKFQAYTTHPEACALPPWLPRTFLITCPIDKANVASAEAAAEAAAAAAKNSTNTNREELHQEAEAARKAAEDARARVPENHKAYGVVICGAALGDQNFEEEFLKEKTEEVVKQIELVTEKLAQESAHCLSAAIYYSLQARVDFLLETHLPSLTRELAQQVDVSLRKAYIKAFDIDLLSPSGQRTGEEDPSFLRDLAGLKAKAGGCGYRNTSKRAPFLNTMNNVLPQMAGEENNHALWPTLVPIFGAESFKSEEYEKRWEVFFSSGSEWAKELESEIIRVKDLRSKALDAAGRSLRPPENKTFDTPNTGFGHGVKKLHRAIFDDIRALEAEALQRRAAKLPQNDQRKLAFEQSRSCRFSNVLFSGTPNARTKFTNMEFHTAVQNVLGAPLSILKPYVGLPIRSNARGHNPSVDPFGNNIKKLIGATGGGTLKNHNAFVDTLSFWLSRTWVPHRGGMHGKPRTCKDIFNHLSPASEGETQRVLQSIIPDLLIDGRFLPFSLGGTGVNLLRGVKTLVDVKTKSCDDKYAACASPASQAVVNKRQQQVNSNYHNRARKLDEDMGFQNGEDGPFTKTLNEYGVEGGQVVAPVVGAFAEMSSHVYAIADLIASLLAAEHCSYFARSHVEAKGVFQQRLFRSWGLGAHLGWARVLIDRTNDLVRPCHGETKRRRQNDLSVEEEDEFEWESNCNPDKCRGSFPH
jgi:hypothetical protein